ncbi:MAG: hypothetical protein WCZ18_02220 [Ottowia sp.]|nr:hypothetical protein [Ottowia sp.]
MGLDLPAMHSMVPRVLFRVLLAPDWQAWSAHRMTDDHGPCMKVGRQASSVEHGAAYAIGWTLDAQRNTLHLIKASARSSVMRLILLGIVSGQEAPCGGRDPN